MAVFAVSLLVVALTAVPIALAARWGGRLGGARLLGALLTWLLPWSVGVAVAALAYRELWFVPFGLVTPVLLGALAAALLDRLRRGLGRRRPRAVAVTAPRFGRTAGAVLGAGLGLAFAVSAWIAGQVVVVAVAAPARSDAPARAAAAGVANPAVTDIAAPGLLGDLVRTAHRGFVRHLPFIGPLADELEALATIAGTDLEVRREFFDRHGWNALVSLPAMQAVIADDDLMADVALANTGDLAAIFRVQRHPRIVALCERDELWRIVNGTRPTEMARELAEIAGRARVR